ncbi:hypothetical protein MPH_04028 [Macrophomina phaseolina MS6]|uniref:Uncharacterized protein n=1 Tax=Macrophomina phaseolina (strain MS6) TaxID=1126212 RepID=K2S151_MACPH|nr:hypothetical protein MPH_04028 [Macrophomina phaseolina MS6]
MARQHWPTAAAIKIKHRSLEKKRWCTLYVELPVTSARLPSAHRPDRTPNIVFVGPWHDASNDSTLISLEDIWLGIRKARIAVERGVVKTIEQGLKVSWDDLEGAQEALLEERRKMKEAVARFEKAAATA